MSSDYSRALVTVGPYLFASVVVVYATFVYKGDSLPVGPTGVSLQLTKGSIDEFQRIVDRSSNELGTKIDVSYLRLESRIVELERKIDNLEVNLTGV